MSDQRPGGWSRRDFLTTATLAGTAGFLGLEASSFAAEPPPETTGLRLDQRPSICVAPQYLAEVFLRAEGFTDVQYIKMTGPKDIEPALASGKIHLGFHFAAPTIIRIEAGDPIVVLAGVHAGCFELFGTDRVRAVRDLKGKTVAVPELGGPQHVFISSMAAYVGLDPKKDISWVTHPFLDAAQLLAERKIDAFLGFPPEPQELRAKKIGHVVVNSTTDKPWSHYFCCMLVGNRRFVQRHPVAVKRAMRAFFKAANVCTVDPERAARFIVDKGLVPRYDHALRTIKDLPYDKWREYDPEDTMRFYGLLLREVGMIKTSPNKLIAQGADWRFLRQLKKS